MRLILASDLGFCLKYGYGLAGIPKSQMKIGWVTTAAKAARNQSFISDIRVKLNENGYIFEEFDLQDKSEDEIRLFFKDKNVIHLEGGNTFYLLKIIRQTGFADILADLLQEGKVYIGTSGGAYIMCPSIEVASWNPGKDRFGVEDFTALNYVPFVLKAHYTDEMEEKLKDKMLSLKYPIRLLRDGQGLLVEDKVYRFVGGVESRL